MTCSFGSTKTGSKALPKTQLKNNGGALWESRRNQLKEMSQSHPLEQRINSNAKHSTAPFPIATPDCKFIFAQLRGAVMNQHLPVSAALRHMQALKRWLLWKKESRPNGKPAKIPYYANGQPRSGKLDTPEDLAQLVTYDEAYNEARAAFYKSPFLYEGLGLALGPDGTGKCFQGIDFDNVGANQLSDLANSWIKGNQSYVEYSPSGAGLHVIGYGRPFQFNLNANGTGIEAYSSGRFFTFTGEEAAPNGKLVDLYDYVGQVLYPRWLAGKTPRNSYAGEAEIVVSPTTIAALRSAIHFHDPNDYGEWIAAGHALKPLGLPGWEIWDTWSQHSLTKYDPKIAKLKWDSFKPDGRTNYQSIFTIAQKREWVNPDGKESLRVRFCYTCGATVALPPLSTDPATGEVIVGTNGQGVRHEKSI